MPTYTWDGGPVRERKAGRTHPLWWTEWNEGITVARDADGVWSQLSDGRTEETLDQYVLVLRGGCRVDVPTAYYSELVAAGYGDHIEVTA